MLKSTPGFVFILYLSLLSMLGFMATDMYLPAFQAIELALGMNAKMMSWSLSLFVAGLALGQLFYGRMAFIRGNRVALLIGLSLFLTATGIMVAFKNSEVFLAGRFVQGLGASAAGVIWQALVMERYEAKRAQEVLGTVMPLVALSPALAPLIGTMILENFHWCHIFLTLGGVGLFLFLATLQLRDLTPKCSAQRGTPKTLFEILHASQYRHSVAVFGGCSAVFFAFLTAWPHMMNAMGYTPEQIGWSFVPQTLAFILGGWLVKALQKQVGSDQMLRALLVLFVSSITVMVCVNGLADNPKAWMYMLPFCGVAIANGGIYPLVVHRALSEFPNHSAQAAGLQNFFQLLFSTLASSVVAVMAETPFQAAMLVMGLCMVWVVFHGHRLGLFAHKTLA